VKRPHCVRCGKFLVEPLDVSIKPKATSHSRLPTIWCGASAHLKGQAKNGVMQRREDINPLPSNLRMNVKIECKTTLAIFYLLLAKCGSILTTTKISQNTSSVSFEICILITNNSSQKSAIVSNKFCFGENKN